jgi:hypothetical protein
MPDSFTNTTFPNTTRADTAPIGDARAASDIYGTGVRTGIYLQFFGLLISAAAGKGRGTKMTCASLAAGLLISWTRLVETDEISPAESIVVLYLLNAILFPAMTSFLCQNAWIGEAFAMGCVLCINLWTVIANLWFWAALWNSLPALGTPGVTWAWTMKSITEPEVRIENLVYLVCSLIFTSVHFVIGWVFLKAAARAWGSADDKVKMDSARERRLAMYRVFNGVLSLVSFIFCIASIETTIRWNGLRPDSDFSHPGQSIPLVVGVFVFFDSVMAVVGKITGKCKRI